MTNFHVGQKVVCVNDTNSPVLSEGRIYTIIRVIGRVLPTEIGTYESGVLLQEVQPREGSCGFAASRFRPVVTRKSDISIFKAMLTTNKRGVPA